MSLETTAPAETAGQSAAPSNEGSGLDTRYQGFSSPDDTDNDNVGALSDAPSEQPEVEDQPAEPDPWEGYEDFEVEGEILKVPSKLKDGYLRLADYTRKTQEVADTRKQLQAREQEIAQRYQQTEEEFNARIELTNVSNQLKQFESIDWGQLAAMIENDPSLKDDYLAQQEAHRKLNQAYMNYQQLSARQRQLVETASSFEQKRTETAKQETAQRLSATRDFAEKNIKGWTPDLDAKITRFAIDVGGYSPESLTQAINPQNYRLLHLAYLGHQSQLRQQSAKPVAQTPAAPTQTVTAKANVSPSFDPERSTMDDYAKDWAARQARKKQ